jgi:hypothetical protein
MGIVCRSRLPGGGKLVFGGAVACDVRLVWLEGRAIAVTTTMPEPVWLVNMALSVRGAGTDREAGAVGLSYATRVDRTLMVAGRAAAGELLRLGAIREEAAIVDALCDPWAAHAAENGE